MRPRPIERRVRLSFAVLGSLVLVASLPCVAGGETVGRLILYVRGQVNNIVLVDPLGRTDRYDDNVPKPGIPGCDRWPGGLEEDEESSANVDSAASARTTFVLDSVQYGRYSVCLHADTTVDVTVVVTFESATPGTAGCNNLERSDRVGAGRQGWTIDVRKSPPKGQCAVRIGRPGQRKRAPKAR